MALGKKTGGRDFKKGWKGGPGRPRIPAEQKAAWAEFKKAQGVARFKYQHIINEMLEWPVERLSDFVKQAMPRAVKGKDGESVMVPPTREAAVIELKIARVLLKAISSGRSHELQQLHELVCGSEPKNIQFLGAEGETINPVKGLTGPELMAGWEVLQQIIKEKECKSTPPQQPSSESPARSSRRARRTEL